MDGAEAIDLNVTLRANARCARVGGRGGRGAAWAARPRETSPSADLGGSSKYSNENFED